MTLAELRSASRPDLARLLASGHPFDPATLAGRVYCGVSLGLPRALERLTWVKFAKLFAADAATGRIRGWNVRTEQGGLDEPWRPRRRRGRPIAFGRFEVMVDGGSVILDYSRGGSALFARLRDPLVSIAPELLLGRSLLAVGGRMLATPSFFALAPGPVLDSSWE